MYKICRFFLCFFVLSLLASPKLINPRYEFEQYQRFKQTNVLCRMLDHARVWSDEKKPIFLGEFLPKSFPNSLFNSLSHYGTKFGKTSIWGLFSPYGSPSSNLSVNNPQAKHPPFIHLKDGRKFRLNKSNNLYEKSLTPKYLKSCYTQFFYDK